MHAILRFCTDVVVVSALILGFGMYSVFMGSALVRVSIVIAGWFQLL